MTLLDAHAAGWATVVSVVVALLVVTAQGAVAAAATAGPQPVAAVGEVPQTPADGAWSEAPQRTVSLSAQQMALPYGGGSVDDLTVQVLANRSHVAIRLTWPDGTNDTNVASPGNFSDAAAVMLRTGSQPPITMGASGTPVNIWYWRASWQFGEDRDGDWTGDMYVYPHPDGETKPGLAAGNPLSKRTYDRYAQNYYAKGFGTLSHAPSQPVRAHGNRTDDGWSVVFVRERTVDGRYDASLAGEEPVYLAFAVWNGSADEANGQKSLTLRFTKLTTDGGLEAVEESGGSDQTGDEAVGTPGDQTDTDGPLISPTFERWLGGVLAAVVVSWLIAYRRLKGGGSG